MRGEKDGAAWLLWLGRAYLTTFKKVDNLYYVNSMIRDEKPSTPVHPTSCVPCTCRRSASRSRGRQNHHDAASSTPPQLQERLRRHHGIVERIVRVAHRKP